jgi:hypothetical protein
MGPSDIAYIVSTIKNSKDMWNQDLRKRELGAQAIGSPEKKLKPLFTSGSGQKRIQGKSLWNLEGMKYFHRAETKWRQIYDRKKDMRVLYNGWEWEKWITTTGSDIKIENGSKKTFKSVMGTWREDSSHNSTMGEEQDDEEGWGFEGGYSSERGCSRHSLDWQSGKLRENLSAESEGADEGEGDDSDGENERSPPLFVVAKVGGSDMNSDDVVESPTKNTRKRKSNIPAVDSHAIATRGKRGHK